MLKNSMISAIVLLTCVKILLIPSYRSTDFNVHRNWLAITRNLPLDSWYFDDGADVGGTVHTLDYPPSFALFEWALSTNFITNWLIQRKIVDSKCFDRLSDREDAFPSDACVIFQRGTVIISDISLIAGTLFASRMASCDTNERNTIALLILSSPALLILDHCHFQYNGAMLGILLLSIGCVLRADRLKASVQARVWRSRFVYHFFIILGAILYSFLLTLKHLYLPLGPIYFSYFFFNYCFKNYQREEKKFSWSRFLGLAFFTLTTVLLPFLPFLVQQPGAMDQLSQMFLRLFPFSRGLCHDYWAGNVWALYLALGKCIRFANKFPQLQMFVPEELPTISPATTALLLLISLLPAMYTSFRITYPLEKKQNCASISVTPGEYFVHALVYCALSGFMLAYHAHEKAIITAIIPLTLISHLSVPHRRLYLRLCALGHFGLFPLLYEPMELVFKTTSYVLHLTVAYALLSKGAGGKRAGRETQDTKLLTAVDKFLFILLAAVWFFSEIIHPLYFKPKGILLFFPLLITSVVCATGHFICWAQCYLLMMNLNILVR
mmetsp:Transcript_20183/g.40180  ORF Transcript_20183/g.40180 Transcript_20183/m.40180 type:complete len:552 (+) Transcript_20183:288-1943(+)